MATAAIISGLASVLGSAVGAVGKGGHGPGSSGSLPGGRPAGGMAPYTPSAAGFGSGGAGAPQGADLRLSQILGQPQRKPDDEMTLGMMMGY